MEQKSIEGKIKSIGITQTTIEKDGTISISTFADYNCDTPPYQGQFIFLGILCEKMIGRKFELKEKYNSDETFPFDQFLRVWNSGGVGCRDYLFVDKRRRK